MKSGKQRRAELKARRIARVDSLREMDPRIRPVDFPLGTVPADASKLVHNNTYGRLPLFYVDRAFVCRGCGSQEVWTAKQQKWWYEEAQGHIDSQAVRCRACRIKERERMGDLTEPALHLRHLCDELKRHGQCAPHDGARDALESALLSKWEGVRVAAVQALCAWGDEASVRAVQSTLSGLAGKPHRWAAVGAMAQALFPHLTDDDQDWAIRLYFLESHPDNRFVLQILFEAFEPRQLLVRLKLEAARSGGARVATDLQQAVARAERRISVTRKEH